MNASRLQSTVDARKSLVFNGCALSLYSGSYSEIIVDSVKGEWDFYIYRHNGWIKQIAQSVELAFVSIVAALPTKASSLYVNAVKPWYVYRAPEMGQTFHNFCKLNLFNLTCYDLFIKTVRFRTKCHKSSYDRSIYKHL